MNLKSKGGIGEGGVVKEEWKVSMEQLCYILQRDVFNINVDEV